MDEVERLGVITVYNLSSRVQVIEVKFDLIKYGLDVSSAEIYNGTNKKISTIKLTHNSKNIHQFRVDISSLSPIIAILKK